MSLHDELREIARHPRATVSRDILDVLARHPEAGVSDARAELAARFAGFEEARAQLQLQAPVGDSPEVRENVAWVCINPDAPTHNAHGFPLKMEAWGTCDYQGHRVVNVENGVSDGEREGLAYLITAFRFRERQIRHRSIEPEDIAVARPLAEFLHKEGYRKAPVVNVEDVARVIAPWLSTTLQDPDDWQMTRARDIATAIKAHLLDGGE